MTGNEYLKLAMRTNDGKCNDRLSGTVCSYMLVDIGEVLNASLGLSGEVGELNDLIKKFIFHKKPMDGWLFRRELGDIMWYVALMCHACGYDLDEIMQMNIEKLKARYPEGFDVKKANNRKDGDV